MVHARAGYGPTHSANSLWHGMNLVRSGAKLFRRTRGATEAESHQVRAINPLRWDKRTRGVSKFMKVVATDHTSQDSGAIISRTGPESTILLGSVAARCSLFDFERLESCMQRCVTCGQDLWPTHMTELATARRIEGWKRTGYPSGPVRRYATRPLPMSRSGRYEASLPFPRWRRRPRSRGRVPRTAPRTYRSWEW